MLDDLLEKGIIELPPSKRHGKVMTQSIVGIIGSLVIPLEMCITMKERIMQLAKDGAIILDLDKAIETSQTIIWYEHCYLTPSLIEELVTVQFRSLEPVMLPVMIPTTLGRPSQYQTSLMEMMKDGSLSLDGGLRGKGIFNNPHFVEERGKVERGTLDVLRGRKGLTLTRSMKFNPLICLNKNLLSLSH